MIFSKTNSDESLNTRSNMNICLWKRTGKINTLVILGEAYEDKNTYRKCF